MPASQVDQSEFFWDHILLKWTTNINYLLGTKKALHFSVSLKAVQSSDLILASALPATGTSVVSDLRKWKSLKIPSVFFLSCDPLKDPY